MLENMFVGNPPGNYDHLLDFSRAVTGSLFFVPTATFLDAVAPEDAGSPPAQPEADVAPVDSSKPRSDGSLGIGSLKEEGQNE